MSQTTERIKKQCLIHENNPNHMYLKNCYEKGNTQIKK